MVEVVGTAPTSVMVITKFVYRRSWQANTILIKGITIDSIKIIKLFKNLFNSEKKNSSFSFKHFFMYTEKTDLKLLNNRNAYRNALYCIERAFLPS